ncbi:MAG: asparagine synthase (glutamine-hydrolyzing), partial [Syntrophaceae bacterium]
SIIDLSPTGHQPMTTPDGIYTICYNGEVYNYREIRSAFELQGNRFRGTSDTEVILQAFAAWGPACVERFIGMFAFALWDSRQPALYLFRDRIGVKPLYYYRHDGIFAFASELKALHAALSDRLEIDPAALGEFLNYGYIAGPRSIYRHICKLEPGHWLKVSAGLNLEKHCYWSIADAYAQAPARLNENDAADALEELMVDAFQKRLIADVPVGVFLSGGIDSSLVTAILARHAKTPIKTFTIGFAEQNYDESGWARRIARHLGTEHTEQIVTPADAKAVLPLWSEIYDEPFGDISGIPTSIVARMTREHVKVSLSADGGDELFCGYPRYRLMHRLERTLNPLPNVLAHTAGAALKILGNGIAVDIARFSPCLRLPALKDRLRKLQAVLGGWQGNAGSAYPYAIGYFLPHEIPALTGCYVNPRPSLDADNLLTAMMRWDLRHYLPEDILTKVDRATMFNSLEGRDPFLDHRLVEYAVRLPLDLTYHGGTMKYLLKKVLARYLPTELFDRPKQGFAVPIYSWLHNDLMDMVDRFLNPDALESQTLVDPETVAQTVAEFKRQKGSIAVDRIWLLLVFMMWRQRYA